MRTPHHQPPEPDDDAPAPIRWLDERPEDDLFGGGGACVAIRRRADPGRPIGTNTLIADGGMATIESLTIHSMAPAWRTPNSPGR